MAEAKKNWKKNLTVRFEAATLAQLEKEAALKGLDLSTYVRSLVFTHQDRQKKK